MAPNHEPRTTASTGATPSVVSLLPGSTVRVRKLRPDGSEKLAWTGVVLDVGQPGLVVRSEFGLPHVDLGCATFRRGDVFVKYYLWAGGTRSRRYLHRTGSSGVGTATCAWPRAGTHPASCRTWATPSICGAVRTAQSRCSMSRSSPSTAPRAHSRAHRWRVPSADGVSYAPSPSGGNCHSGPELCRGRQHP